jgi:hypothetical protein
VTGMRGIARDLTPTNAALMVGLGGSPLKVQLRFRKSFS